MKRSRRAFSSESISSCVLTGLSAVTRANVGRAEAPSTPPVPWSARLTVVKVKPDGKCAIVGGSPISAYSGPAVTLFLPILTTVVVGSFAIAFAFYMYVVALSAQPLIDFDVYTQASKALLAGENIYSKPYAVIDRAGRVVTLPYLYPPFLAHLLSTCASLPQTTLKGGWCLLNFFCMLCTVLCLSSFVEPSWWGRISRVNRILLLGFFTFCFEPIYVGLGDGQVTGIVMALFSLFVAASMRGKQVWAGIALAAAIQIKMSPALLILAPLLFRQWRTVASCLVAVVGISLISFLELGTWAPTRDFFQSLGGTVDDSLLGGFTFNFVLNRVLLDPIGLGGSTAARWALKVASAALTVVGAALLSRQQDHAYLRVNAFLITCMIMLSPIIWFHHLAWMLLPIAVLSMRPATTSDDHLRNLTIALGLYFGLSQTMLLLHWTLKLTPGLLPVVMLVPPGLLVSIGASLYSHKVPQFGGSNVAH